MSSLLTSVYAGVCQQQLLWFFSVCHVGHYLVFVIAQCTSLWAFSETIILFFESFVLPMHIRLYFGFYSSWFILTTPIGLNVPSHLIFESKGCCSLSLAHFRSFSRKRKMKKRLFFRSHVCLVMRRIK